MKIGNFNLDKDSIYIIAQLSANYNENLQNALDTIKAAKEIGANAINCALVMASNADLVSLVKKFMVKN